MRRWKETLIRRSVVLETPSISDSRLVFKAHRLLYHSTLGLRVIKKKKKKVQGLGYRVCGVGQGQMVEMQITLLFFITLEPRVECYNNL